MTRYLTNGRIFDGETLHADRAVALRDGRIDALIPATEIPDGADRVDLGGKLLAPGFVDVQVNGGGGMLYNNDRSADGLAVLAAAHRRFGSTTVIPTLISDRLDVMQEAADAMAEAIKRKVPGVRGVHFEGPYLNTARKGVHDAEVIRPVDPEALALLSRTDLGVVITTLAPEKVPSSFIHDLTVAGVRVCAGHTAATYEQIREALDTGLRGFTHLYNAMSPLTSREPGVVGAALEDPHSWCGIIADGHHIHDASLKVACAAKAPGKMMLVSDAMPTVGAEVKEFVLNGETIIAKDGRCATAAGTLAGSDLDMASAVRHMVEQIKIPLSEALRMASLYPACFLRLDDRIGRIAPGMDADLVLLSDDLTVSDTWIKGDHQSH